MSSSHEFDTDYEPLLPAVCSIAREAGKLILGFRLRNDFSVVTKPDGSPVTTADETANRLIVDRLKDLTPGLPIVSEEMPLTRDPGSFYWTVDPLDGTKNFIQPGNNWYYVKIALIKNETPVLGVVYIPAHDEVYFSAEGHAAYKQQGDGFAKEIRVREANIDEPFFIAHGNPKNRPAFPAIKAILDDAGFNVPNKMNRPKDAPGAIQVAQGWADIDIDPGTGDTIRGGNGHSWDYAPDEIILRNAGGIMLSAVDLQPVKFTHPTDHMDAMINVGDRKLGKRLFPKL